MLSRGPAAGTHISNLARIDVAPECPGADTEDLSRFRRSEELRDHPDTAFRVPSMLRGALRMAERRPMSPLSILLHAWRLRRVRRAFATLNLRLTAYERAYGTGVIKLTDVDLQIAGISWKAE